MSLRLMSSFVLAAGGALTALAAPPQDTAPAPIPPTAQNQPSDKQPTDKSATDKQSDPQRSPDARKDSAPGSANSANAALNSSKQAVDNAAGAAKNTANQATDAARSGANQATNAANQAGNAARNGANQASDAVRNGANQAGDAARNAVGQASDAARNGANQTTEAARTGANQATDAARNSVNQATDAARNGANAANNAAQNAANNAAGAVNRNAPNVGANVNANTNANTNLGATGANAGANIGSNVGANIGTALGLGFGAATNGLTISSVQPNSVFGNVGLLPGDQLVSIGGQRIANQAAFSQYLYGVQPGQRIPLVVMRNGVQQQLYWTPNQGFAQMLPPQGGIGYGAAPGVGYGAAPGFGPGNVNATVRYTTRNDLGIRFDENVPNAAVVAGVINGSPAAQAGVRPGDAIVGLNDQPVQSAPQFWNMLDQMPPNSPLNLQLARQQNVQVNPDVPRAVTAGKPVIPVQPAPVGRPARRGLFRNR
jgi:hypothetical protein